jgi:anthraniloyl-CoA monooxygenase
MKAYTDLDPLRFAYKLMTRSKRITHENLRRRDPKFVEAYEGLEA